MTQFEDIDGQLVAAGHGHTEQDLRAGLEGKLKERGRSDMQAQMGAEGASFSEGWHNPEHGYGHDCSLHPEVDQSLWSPGCGTFEPVTITSRVAAPPQVERAADVARRVQDAAAAATAAAGGTAGATDRADHPGTVPRSG